VRSLRSPPRRYLGRLASERSPGLFIHAAKRVLDELPPAPSLPQFHIAGDGALREGLVQLAADLNISSHVTFLGKLPPTEVPAFLSTLSLLVNTRMTETFGIANTEANLAGVPVVCFDVAGNTESLPAGGGARAPELSLESLTEAILLALSDQAPTCSPPPPAFGLGSFINGYSSFLSSLFPSPLPPLPPPPSTLPINNHVKMGKLRVGYSIGSAHLRSAFLTIFPEMFPYYDVVVEREPTRDPEEVAIFVASVLDGGCGASWEDKCKEKFRSYKRRYGNSRMVLLSGEAWNVRDAAIVGADVVWGAHKTREHFPDTIPLVYWPNAATSFSERALATYRDLEVGQKGGSARKFAAYMYSRCDRPEREEFFKILNEKAKAAGQQVDALGACGGMGGQERPEKREGRCEPHNTNPNPISNSSQVRPELARRGRVHLQAVRVRRRLRECQGGRLRDREDRQRVLGRRCAHLLRRPDRRRGVRRGKLR
jgi:hypothetical protein